MKYFVTLFLVYTLLTIIFSLSIFGLRFFSLVSGSMAPQIKSGSFIVVKKQQNYQPNDVISFYTLVNDQEAIVAHRIIEVGGNVYVTKGDANRYQDRLLVLPRLIIGKVIVVIPLLGYFFGAVNTSKGTFLLIILQFTLVLLINQFYLKQKIYRSDIIAFLILLVGYFVSFFHLLSYALGRKVEVHTDVSPKESGHGYGNETKEETPEKSSKKSKRYNSTKVKKEKKNKNKEQKSTCK